MKLLFLVNNPDFFLSHRLPVALAAQAAGLSVHVAAPPTGRPEELLRHGFTFHPVPLDRSKGRPHRELASFFSILSLYRKVRPEIVHHVTIKPVLYGSLAARLAGVPAMVNAFSGLGFVFIRKGAIAALARRLILLAYRVALRHPNHRAIFQNPDDCAVFVDRGLVRESEAVLIKGSGADLARFRDSAEPAGSPVVLLASRMLWDKGVGEFVAAAEALKAGGMDARFVLVGATDPGNPASIPDEWLQAVRERGAVEWLGHRDDIEKVLAESHVVCLPSYREGLPKVLIEAAACGRAIVATDVPGCREIVHDGRNGILVRARDAAGLAGAIERLLRDPALRKAMGKAGRELAVREFSDAKVADETLSVYRSLGARPAPRELPMKTARYGGDRNATPLPQETA